MTKIFALTLFAAALASCQAPLRSAQAQQSPQSVLRDARGNTIGTATRDSQGTTVFRDSRGNTTGTSSFDSRGNTVFRDNRGSTTGTLSAPSRR